jgi:hypothetical protein
MDFYASENSEDKNFFKLIFKRLCSSILMNSNIIPWIYNFMHV